MAEAIKISKKELEQYEQLEKDRLELGSQVRAIEREQERLKPRMLAYVRENGGKLLSALKFGYVLNITMKGSYPKWKDEFVQRLGLEEAKKVADAAAAIKKESFSLQRAH